MSIQRPLSNDSLDSLADSTHHLSSHEPHSRPFDTIQRRQRLLRIGSAAASIHQLGADETSSLNGNQQNASYGTLPSRRASPVKRTNFRSRRSLPPALVGIETPHVLASQPHSPNSPTSFRGLSASYFRTQRPISAYDTPLPQAETEDDLHARTNGIRVWYSSFSSIDWLHDAIKESVRFSRIRRGKSLRSRFRLLVDKSMGWIIVTLVGFLTAVVAFVVVRVEQWFFDSKEGYCRTDWTKAKRFCCPSPTGASRGRASPLLMDIEGCTSWRTWGEVFGPTPQKGETGEFKIELTQYIAYAIIAVSRCRGSTNILSLTKSNTAITGFSFVSLNDIPYCFDFFCDSQRVRRAIPQFRWSR